MLNLPTAEINRVTDMVPGPLQLKKEKRKKRQHLVLIVIDTCSGYRSVFPARKASEETAICEPTGRLIHHYGILPRSITSDQ